MYIADMHCDSLSLVSGDRGLVNSYNFSKNNPQLQFVASFTKGSYGPPPKRRKKTFEDLNVYLSECDRLGIYKVNCSRDVFHAEENKRSALFALEGGGGFSPDAEELRILKSGGLSVFGMCWDKNELCSSSSDAIDEGLTDEGRLMVDRLCEQSIIIDCSHVSDRSFYEIMELTAMPVIATHSNFREIADSSRNLTRKMAEMIAARGGVIGINLYPKFLSGRDDATTDDILRQIDFGLSALGENAIGFGFDIDGTSGNYPKGINPRESIHDQVIDLLLSHYSHSVVEKIAGLNVIEFLKNNLE